METTILLNTIIKKLEGSFNYRDLSLISLPKRLADVVPSAVLPQGFIPKNYLNESIDKNLSSYNPTYDVKYNIFLMYLLADMTVHDMIEKALVSDLFIQYLNFEKELIQNHINSREYVYDKYSKTIFPTNYTQFGGGDKALIDDAVLAAHRAIALVRISDVFRETNDADDLESSHNNNNIYVELFRPLGDLLIFKINRIFYLVDWDKKMASWEIMMLIISLKRVIDMINYNESRGLVRTKPIKVVRYLYDPDGEDDIQEFINSFKPPSRTSEELQTYISLLSTNLSKFIIKQSRDTSKTQLKVYLDLDTTEDDGVDSAEIQETNYIIDRCMLIPLIFMKDEEFLTCQLNTNNSYLNTVMHIIKSCENLYPLDDSRIKSSIGLIGSPMYLDMIMTILTYNRLFKILIPIGLVWENFLSLRQNIVYLINRVNMLISELKLYDIQYENKMLIGRISSSSTYLLRLSALYSKLFINKFISEYPETYPLIDVTMGNSETNEPDHCVVSTTKKSDTGQDNEKAHNNHETFRHTDNMFSKFTHTTKNIIIDKAFDKTYERKSVFKPIIYLSTSSTIKDSSKITRKPSTDNIDDPTNQLITPKSFTFTKEVIPTIPSNGSLDDSPLSISVNDIKHIDIDDSNNEAQIVLIPNICTIKHCRCIYILSDEESETQNKLSKEQDEHIGTKNILTIDDLIALGKSYHCKNRVIFKGLCLKKLADLVDPLEDFNKMKGIKELKQKIVNNVLFFMKKSRKNSHILNIAMYGPPGVGKTTICKHIANIYSKAGILKTNKVESVRRSDLVGRYLGETAIKTQDVINKIKGGILLIDEVYSLGHFEKRDSFSKECLDTLTHNLGQDDSDFICIVAGYEEDVKNCFFGQNKGLQRRFPFIYKIDEYEDTVMADLLYTKLIDEDWKLTEKDKPLLVKFIRENKDKFENFMGDIENFVLRVEIMNNADNPWESSTKTISYDLLVKTLSDIHNIDPSKKKDKKDESWRNMYI